ncbi:hypothetical protein GALMADRAFT_124817 [Galerina marginata CBS 339.88]|uniref:Metaxin glutathione S-transferase domain-containing protein n=1 Tax=Galerina marginata (strain CBS 339.88) TaxID=685588 RepID=A0A067T3J2_GALM3|nr:hypothetical protein GALMADRAFT_124817 [Galerina marginata CBS 339.88]
MASFFSVPSPIVAFNAYFPLKTYPNIKPLSKSPVTAPTLWLLPPREEGDSLLSADVECLKWQAYLALRGVSNIKLRWDIAPEGSIDGALPNLHVPASESLVKSEKLSNPEDGELLAAHSIPAWVDAKLGVDSGADPLEGYKDQASRVESRAWVSLLEGVVHAALLISQPPPSYLHSLIFPSSTPPVSESLQKILLPPPAPLIGLSSFFPPSGARINTAAVVSQYRDAIASLSDLLGTDNWFLGSSEPTPLDALAFAYLHSILYTTDPVRIEVTRRVNLVAWEWRVRCLVHDSFSR